MRIPSQLSLTTLCLAAWLCVTGVAQAAIAVYTNEASFLAAVSAPGVDTFDDLSSGLYGDTVDRNAGAYSYRAYSAAGLWGVGGPGDHALSSNAAFHPIVFAHFSGNVSAFGGQFFASDLVGNHVPGTVVLTAVGGGVLTYDLSSLATTSFVGFVSSEPLSSITLGTDGGPYWPTANNVVLAVPEPATYGMLLAGISLLGMTARRRG